MAEGERLASKRSGAQLRRVYAHPDLIASACSPPAAGRGRSTINVPLQIRSATRAWVRLQIDLSLGGLTKAGERSRRVCQAFLLYT